MVFSSDVLDNMEQLLRQILAELKNENADDDTEDFPRGLRPLKPGRYVVVETDDMDDVDQGGSVTLSPGEEKILATFKQAGKPLVCYAVGATDANDVQYRLELDNSRTVGGRTNSPLGTLNSPFSFPEKINGAVLADKKVQYIASRPSSATGDVDLVARLHVEVLS